MNQHDMSVKRALISVSNKEGIIPFATALHALHVEIIATGGTRQLLSDAGIPVREILDVTGFPEIMDGRVKTLHPKIHAGILGLREKHADIAKAQAIEWIDLVVVNLYPFAETIQRPDCTFDQAIENIDIGGPAMIRAAAKNMGWVGVMVDPADYVTVVNELTTTHQLSDVTRKMLATKAFQHTAAYDAMISEYLSAPTELHLQTAKYAELRYGENPHQSASAYHLQGQGTGILSATQHQGKSLSYNNITDADAAYRCVQEFSQPACVIVKHANPCGVAVAEGMAEAFIAAFQADSLSAFGGVVALNRHCTAETAQAIKEVFIEVVIAPSYSQEALALLASKPNLRVLALPNGTHGTRQREMKYITGGLLIQDVDQTRLTAAGLTMVTQSHPTADQIAALLFAWQVVKHIKSNAILIAKENVTLGIGAGQVSRVDAVEIAIKKAGMCAMGAVLASDAFFPFRDSIDLIAAAGIKTIIQPGGSVRDSDIITACNEYNIAMAFTGIRCFKH